MPNGCFCEAIRDGIVRQPANTWSCIAFVVAGAILCWRGIRLHSDSSSINPIRTMRVYSLLYGAALVLIGVGSGFYHASLSFTGQFFDVFGMYLIGTFILLYNVSRLRPVPDGTVAAVYIILNIILAYILYTLPELRRYLFAILLIAALGLEFRVRRTLRPTAQSKYLWYALASIVTGFLIWILDITRLVCSPRSYVQGHAVWHIAGAAAATLLYTYYWSEQAGGKHQLQN